MVGELQGILEGWNYKNIDIKFPFLAGFRYICTERVEETSLTKIHVPYSEVSEGWNEIN